MSSAAQLSLQQMLDTLPQASVQRFMALRQRCFEMRDIASRIRGQAAVGGDSGERGFTALPGAVYDYDRRIA